VFAGCMLTPVTLACPQLCDLYENDCIFDKFDCCVSGDGTRLATGSYSNLFKVLSRSSVQLCLVLNECIVLVDHLMDVLRVYIMTNRQPGCNTVQVTSTSPGPDSLLEASRDPLRKRLQQPSAKVRACIPLAVDKSGLIGNPLSRT
jgi:hypothetical protein